MPGCANPHFSNLLAEGFLIRRRLISFLLATMGPATPKFSAAIQVPRLRKIFRVSYFLPFTFPTGSVESLHLESHGTALVAASFSHYNFYFVQFRLYRSSHPRLSNPERVA